jgi:hypothetical protein
MKVNIKNEKGEVFSGRKMKADMCCCNKKSGLKFVY